MGANVLVFGAATHTEKKASNPLLTEAVLPLSDRFKQLRPNMNKANTVLNARLARWVIEDHSEDLRRGTDRVRSMVSELASNLPSLPRRPVNSMTDSELLAFIAKHYQSGESATSLLRHLRDEHLMSCEQKRFGHLFSVYCQSHGKGRKNHDHS